MATHLHFSQVLPTFQLEFYLQYPRSHASLVQTTQHLIPRRAQEKKICSAHQLFPLDCESPSKGLAATHRSCLNAHSVHTALAQAFI